jgi:hypothetical protein
MDEFLELAAVGPPEGELCLGSLCANEAAARGGLVVLE